MKGFKGRPTTDFGREGLFNLLRTRMDMNGAQVLDLFSGTGMVGIECASRGAAFITSVEKQNKACSYIKEEQLRGYEWDKISETNKGVIFTKEKGGKQGNIYINLSTYSYLEDYIKKNGVFKINRQKYFKEIRDVCRDLNITSEGTHGFMEFCTK